MLSLSVILLLASALLSQAMPADFYNNTVTGCSYSATCSAGGVSGVCVSISAGCCSGTTTSNLCPGSSDIKCCTNNKCSTPNGSGTCMQTSLCSSKGGVSYSGYCTGPSDLQCCVQGSSGKITRDEIIARAQDWVNRQIPYSQTSTTDGYRQDCSGYTSMSWKTSKPGYTTHTMPNICTKITKSDLKAGDAILKPDQHVLIFHKWVDSDNFMGYAERTSGTVATYYKTSYSYYSSNGYYPCRYNNVA